MQMQKQQMQKQEMEEEEEEFWDCLDEKPVPDICVDALIVAVFLGVIGVFYILAKIFLFFILH